MFDIFDHRWSLSFNNNSSNSDIIKLIENTDYVFDIRYNDIIEFFKYNQCVHRFKKVWRVFYRVLRDDGIRNQDDLDIVLAGLIRYQAEEEITEFRHYVYSKFKITNKYGQYKCIADMVGSTGSQHVYEFSCRVIDKLEETLGANKLSFYEYQCMLAAVTSKQYNLFYFIFNQLKEKSPWLFNTSCGFTFSIDQFNEPEIVSFILQNTVHTNIVIVSFPYAGFQLQHADIIMPIVKKKTSYSFENAYKMGNVDILELMYEWVPPIGQYVPRYIPSLEILRFYLSKHKLTITITLEIELACSHSLELIKYLHDTGKFSSLH